MNEYNEYPLLHVFFPPDGNGILMQILLGEPIIPLQQVLETRATPDLVELLFEPRKKEGEISNKGKEVSKEDRKDDLTRSLHEFFFPLHEFLRHFSSRGERGDSKNVSKRKLEAL